MNDPANTSIKGEYLRKWLRREVGKNLACRVAETDIALPWQFWPASPVRDLYSRLVKSLNLYNTTSGTRKKQALQELTETIKQVEELKRQTESEVTQDE